MHLKKFVLVTSSAIAASVMIGCASTQPSSDNWQVLFDGTSTDAFRAYKRDTFPAKGWAVQNGTLKTIVRGDVVDIITKEKFDDFELEYEWKVSPGGNSGVMYNVAEIDGPPWFTGPEVQVLDDSRHPDGRNPKTSAGALYALVAPNAKKLLNKVGEFNKSKIIIKGNHGEHWLNGEKVVEYEIGSPELQRLIAESKFANIPLFMKEASGHIAFQHHGEEVWFRNISVRRL